VRRNGGSKKVTMRRTEEMQQLQVRRVAEAVGPIE